MSYADFLARKALTVAPVGFEPTDYTANLFQFQRDIVGSRLVMFDALGHVPHEEDPAQTVAAVQAFLAQ